MGADNLSDGSPDDGEDDGGKIQGKRIYERAYTRLKYMLYFVDFFPTDEDRAALVYECWMTSASMTTGVSDNKAYLEQLLYRFEYDKKVRPSPTHHHLPLPERCPSTLDDLLFLQLGKRISSIRNVFVTKSAGFLSLYYASRKKKVAALRDDRYVYPGDPVRLLSCLTYDMVQY